MPIRYDPAKFLNKIAPKSRIEKMLTDRFTLKKSALKITEQFSFLDKNEISQVALKTIKGYKKRIREDEDQKAEILDDPKQLIQRVRNEVVLQVSGAIKDRYAGEFYTWLPSDAEEPDPEHQLKYGKTFQVGVGEMPGDRYGCQCGMEIQVDDPEFKL